MPGVTLAVLITRSAPRGPVVDGEGGPPTTRRRYYYSPVAFAMISFDTFAGTSAYESNTME